MSTRKAALVTGAARRVGRAIALHLADEGWDVGVHYNGSADEAESAALALRDRGANAKTYQADLSDATVAKPLIRTFCGDFPDAALLVNSASVFARDTIETFDPSQFDHHLSVNARAPIQLALAFHEQVREEACIVNMLDQKVVNLTPDYFSYTVSKCALLNATQMLAMGLAPKTRVNGIAPGIVLPSGDLSEEQFRNLHKSTLLGVGVSMEEICRSVAFFAESPAITGQVLTIDGGRHLTRPYPYEDLPRE